MSRLNPYAPPAYNGLAGDYPNGWFDVNFDNVYEVTLDATQMLRDQQVAIDTDADFCWRAFQVVANEGTFSIRFSDSQGYYLSNGMLLSATFFQGTVQILWPIFPEIIIPAGGRIGIDIQDLSGAENTVQLVFRGVKRYSLPS